MNEAELRAWHTAYEDEIVDVIEQSRPRCATCRWWERYAVFNGYGVCELTKQQFLDELHPDSLAHITMGDADGGATVTAEAELSTHESFGCVQHLPKADI